jgi:small subunit ribosomal protein S19
MSRVKWKGPYVESKLLKKIQNATVVSKNDIKTISRSSVILPKFIGLNIRVHNGKTFVIVKIVDEMVGYKLGEFVLTRKQFSFKKKKNNKK